MTWRGVVDLAGGAMPPAPGGRAELQLWDDAAIVLTTDQAYEVTPETARILLGMRRQGWPICPANVGSDLFQKQRSCGGTRKSEQCGG